MNREPKTESRKPITESRNRFSVLGSRLSALSSRLSAISYRLSVLCFLFSVLGCHFSLPKDPQTLIQNLPTDPENLNPLISNSVYASTVSGFIYEQLFDLDNETIKPKPKLALRWEISKDHLQYTFYLRKNVRWQDGKPLTADDVIFTYEKIKDPKVDAAPIRNYFKDVLKAEKLDDFTVRFIYRQPYVDALYTIGLMFVLPKHLFDNGSDFNTHPANREPVGTGPFRFVEWKTGRHIILKRFENYWGEPYHFEKMVFKIIPDQLITFRLFKKHDVDLTDLTALQWARQTSGEKFSKEFVKHQILNRFGAYSYIGWNLKRPYFKEAKVRLALAHLIDKEAINQKLLFGLHQPITGPYYPFGPNYNSDLKPIPFDLEKAKKLLDEAGWKDSDGDGIRDKNGIPFKFTFLFSSGGRFVEQLTPILQKNFLEAGIQMELRRLESITVFKLLQDHDFDAAIAGWGRGAGEEDLYQIWHSSQIKGGSNFVGYANPEVDRLLEEGRHEFDDNKRAQIYRRVHRILYDDQPYVFLYARPDLIAHDARFKNVKEYPIGLDMREWVVE